jgi:hypothetical protein
MFDPHPSSGRIERDHFGNSPEIRNKVQYNDPVLRGADAETASKLLDKYSSTVGCPHEDDHIHVGDVYALVEKIDCAHEVEIASPKSTEIQLTLTRREIMQYGLHAQIVLP